MYVCLFEVTLIDFHLKIDNHCDIPIVRLINFNLELFIPILKCISPNLKLIGAYLKLKKYRSAILLVRLSKIEQF